MFKNDCKSGKLLNLLLNLVIMAIDHIRDYFAINTHSTGLGNSPTLLTGLVSYWSMASFCFWGDLLELYFPDIGFED